MFFPRERGIDGNAILVKGVYNRIIKDYGLEPLSFKITTYNDAPAGSGLGTSSTMVVTILKAFIEWLGLPLGDYELARLAYEIERKDLGLAGGKQDQYAAAFGGFNYMEFLKDDMVIVNPLKVKRWVQDELEASMLLYFTGKSRSSAAIIDEQKKSTSEGENDAVKAMHKIKQSAIDMKLAILKGDINSFAEIIREGWENKKKMADDPQGCWNDYLALCNIGGAASYLETLKLAHLSVPFAEGTVKKVMEYPAKILMDQIGRMEKA